MGQKKRVKLEDIAQRLNVSIVTVSNALKGRKVSAMRCEIKLYGQRRRWGTRALYWRKSL